MSGGMLGATLIDNYSAISWIGGQLLLNANATDAALDNRPGASFAIVGNGQELGVSAAGTASKGSITTQAAMAELQAGTASVSNEGTITMDGAPGSAQFNAPLLNTGTVLVNQRYAGPGRRRQLARRPAHQHPSRHSPLRRHLRQHHRAELQHHRRSLCGVQHPGGRQHAGPVRRQRRFVQRQSPARIRRPAVGQHLSHGYGTLMQTGGTIAGSGTLLAFGTVTLGGGLQTGSGTTRLTCHGHAGRHAAARWRAHPGKRRRAGLDRRRTPARRRRRHRRQTTAPA